MSASSHLLYNFICMSDLSCCLSMLTSKISVPDRFAHLISVDFFADLMSVLHSLAETGVSGE